MAICLNCDKEIAEDAEFCTSCGKPVVKVQDGIEEQRKIVSEGQLHKCPNCGELLKSFTTACPACGYELRNVKTNSPVECLANKIEQASSLDEKNELIANFYIPNTKEDIYEFFILALSNLEDKSYDTDDAWRAKLDQAYHKAKLSFGDTEEFEYISQIYSKAVKQQKAYSFTRSIKQSKFLQSFLLVVLGVVLGVIGNIGTGSLLYYLGAIGRVLLIVGIVTAIREFVRK